MGWEVQVVTDDVPDYNNAISIIPNIEHAYVYYMDRITDRFN